MEKKQIDLTTAATGAATVSPVGVVNLSKGATVNLSKITEGMLKKLTIGLGWDTKDGEELDFDLSMFGLDSKNKVRGAEDFLFYNTAELTVYGGAAVHAGDDQTGSDDVHGDGVTDEEDETIDVELDKIPAYIKKLVFVVTIHDEIGNSTETFANAEAAFMNIRNAENGKEIAHYDLESDFGSLNSCKFCALERQEDNTWKFVAIGDGSNAQLAGYCAEFGLGVA